MYIGVRVGRLILNIGLGRFVIFRYLFGIVGTIFWIFIFYVVGCCFFLFIRKLRRGGMFVVSRGRNITYLYIGERWLFGSRVI